MRYVDTSGAVLESWVFHSWEELTADIGFVTRSYFSVAISSMSAC